MFTPWESIRMSDPAALVPVPFFAPARVQTGNAGTYSNDGQRARRTTRVVHPKRSVVHPPVDAGLVYNRQGLRGGDKQLGWIVNIWA